MKRIRAKMEKSQYDGQSIHEGDEDNYG